MSTDVLSADPAKNPTYYLVEDEDHHHESGGSTAIGFWMYLMSDCLIFAILFATYGVLGTSYAGGPTPREIFELPLVALNTSMLLLSSITYGFAMIAMEKNQKSAGHHGPVRSRLPVDRALRIRQPHP